MTPEEKERHETIFDGLAALENLLEVQDKFFLDFQRKFNEFTDAMKSESENFAKAQKDKMAEIITRMENTLPDYFFESGEVKDASPSESIEEIDKPEISEKLVEVVESIQPAFKANSSADRGIEGDVETLQSTGKVTGKSRYDWMSILAYVEEILIENNDPMPVGELALIAQDKGFVLTSDSLKVRLRKSSRFTSIRSKGWGIDHSATPIKKLMKDYGLNP